MALAAFVVLIAAQTRAQSGEEEHDAIMGLQESFSAWCVGGAGGDAAAFASSSGARIRGVNHRFLGPPLWVLHHRQQGCTFVRPTPSTFQNLSAR